VVLGPFANSDLWDGFGGQCEDGSHLSPIVLYDQLSNRWMLSQIVWDVGLQCVAVSTGPDPTGTFHRYAFQVSEGTTAFPQIGLWPDGYYLSFNEYVGLYPDAQPAFCSFEREAMLAGDEAQMVCFRIAPLPNGDEFWLPQPVHLEGLMAPPAGAPHPFIMAYDDEVWGGSPDATQDFYKIWYLSVDWTATGNSTLTGPIDASTAEFDASQCYPEESYDCVPQPNTATQLDRLSQVTSYRAVYRRFGAAHVDGAHSSLWLNHTVNTSGGYGPTVIRWAEIRDPLGSPGQHQAGTWFLPDGEYRFMGSLSVDDSGNMLLAYSLSSESTFPSIRYAGRLVTDPLGLLLQGENELWAGTGSLSGGGGSVPGGNWGRYPTVSLDESDGCSFWFTNEYYESPDLGWKTRVGATRYAACAATAGTLAGTVTTSANGDPIAGANVTAENGHGDLFQSNTDDDGAYAILLPAGTYEVTVSAFGFTSTTEPAVEVTAATTTTMNAQLEVAEPLDVDGFVTDGSGAGWPLYATVTITAEGSSPRVLHTDPQNGYYVAEGLSAQTTYTFYATASTPTGYVPETRVVMLGERERQENFALLVDDVCVTPGYVFGDSLVTEDFESTFPPDGWKVTHDTAGCDPELGNPQWNTENLIGRPNVTGGSGRFAIADADACDNMVMLTNMVAPQLDLSNLGENDAIRISWNHDYIDSNSHARVEAWDGAEWVTVADLTGHHDGGPVRRHVITTIGAGLDRAKFRWHYSTSGFARWWQVDNVEVRAGSCQFPGGGIVLGNVYDANTGEPINGARVEVDTGEVVGTVATPNDPTLDDGFYSVSVTLASQKAPGVRTLTVTAPGYHAVSRDIVPTPGSTARENFELTAGILKVEPKALRARVPIGGAASKTLTLSNIGTANLDFDILEVNFPRPPRAPAGNTLQNAGQWVSQFSTGSVHGYGAAWYPTRNTLWISDYTADDFRYRCHEFEPDGTMTGNTINCYFGDFGGSVPGDLTFNPLTNTFWMPSLLGDLCLHEIDPVALERTGNTICGPWTVQQFSVAYDPATNTYYVGGYYDPTLWQINPDGTVVRSIVTGLSASGLAYNPDTRHLFVQVRGSPQRVHILDAADPNLAEIGTIELLDENGNPAYGDYAGGGLTFDCNGHLVSVNVSTRTAYVNTSGEEGGTFCSLDIPWFEPDPTSGMITAAGSSSVNARFNALDMPPGCDEAHLRVNDDTRYGTTIVRVGITVAFGDVAPNHPADAYIHGLATALRSGGCGGGHFCPGDPLTRRAAARWLARAAYGADFLVSPATGQVFQDVAPDSFGAGEIELLAGKGVITGCSDDPARFCPMQSISRAELAVWQLRALEGADYVPPICKGLFGDVPCAVTREFPFADWIEDLATRVPATACSTDPLLFCPDTPVTRGEASIFTVGAFDLPICR
ncbi:MAG: carboxypeptidase regulatory-like domain-containing protein, partial [Vicinamibacteraceae bacterium]